MDEMTRNMNGLLELNQQMISDILQLRMGLVHGQGNPDCGGRLIRRGCLGHCSGSSS